MAILIDTSALLAYASEKDARHSIASQMMKTLTYERRIVPAPVLSELFYMTAVRLNYGRAVQLFISTRAAFDVQPLAEADMIRMATIMMQYRAAEFDYVDAALMALAERLNIQRIFTFDRRDFSMFRPTHCEYLAIIP
jgi:hypothetical protein